MNLINKVFDEFNSSGIDYAILRGYLDVNELYCSSDLDIYLDNSSFKKASTILIKHGFRKPKINACNYPHVQFVNIINGKLVKFDFVTDLFFGKELYHFAKRIDIKKDVIYFQGKKVFRHDLAIILFLLHIIYDKGYLSDANKKRLKEFKSLHNEEKFALYLPEGFSELLSNPDSADINKKIEVLHEHISECFLLEPFKKAKKFINRTNRNCLWRYRLNRLHRKSIAIIGVDGSGKSTTINGLAASLGDSCSVQYMGFKNMETEWGKRYENQAPIKPKILRYFYIWKEMRFRYKKHRFKSVGITVFDRFPWEAYDNAVGKYKIVYWFLFMLLFPKPKEVYYIYCSAETSLKRKDDITDKKVFISMKNRFDKKYKNKYMSFDSDNETTDQIVNSICKNIMETNMFEYLF